MNDDEFVTLASFPDAVTASIVRAQLEEEGIRTFLQGSEAANALWHVGTALGGVRLQVVGRDLPRALQIVDRIQPGVTRFNGETVWVCGDCGECLDAAVEKCPMCGADRSRVLEREPATDVTLEELTAAALADGDADDVARQEVEDQDERRGAELVSAEESETAVGDGIAKRAWRSALISYVCIPLAFYTPWLLFEGGSKELSPQGWRYYLGALVLTVPITLVALILALGLLLGWGLGPLIDHYIGFEEFF